MRNKYHTLVACPGLYVYANSREPTAYNRICSENMDKTMRNFIKKILLVLSGGIAAVSSALFASFFMGNKTTTFELKCPFVDDENLDFILNSILQSIALFIGCFFYAGIEIAMTIFESFASAAPRLIYNEFAQLIEMYEQKRLTESQFRAAFKNVVVMSLDYERYARSFDIFIRVFRISKFKR